jgi:transcription-repair coupling factor (superfamily II helicase)
MTADLDPILHRLADHERIEALAITLREQAAARLHVAPALTAARTAIVAALARLTQRPLLYIVGSGEAALRAREDLCQWLDPDTVLLFPAGDALPYEPMSPGNDVIAGRLRVLRALGDERRTTNDERRMTNGGDDSSSFVLGPSSLVVVAPIKALLQPTLSPAERDEASIQLKRGDEYNLDELVARWVAMGYRIAPTVEEPGELNRRGGIVDIFPPGNELPLRIEFFGDEIDSLRRFDPITQRSEAQVREAMVGPAHEIPLWRRERAVERLRALETTDLRREALDEWESAIARIEQGERFEGRALFAPFFWEAPTKDERRTTNDESQNGGDSPSSLVFRPSSLLAHLPLGAPVIFSELALLEQQASEQHHHAEERRKLHIEAGELPADFPRPYQLWDVLIAQADTAALVNLSNNDLDLGDGGWGMGVGAQLPSPIPHPPSPFSLPNTLFAPPDLFGGQLKRLVDDIAGRLRDGEQVVVVTPQAARVQELVEEVLSRPSTTDHQPPAIETDDSKSSVVGRLSSFVAVHGSLDEGWRSADLNTTLYTDAEIFGWRQRRPVAERKRKRDRSAEERAAFLRGLKVGDYVVHIEHGIAVYDGLIRRTVGKTEREYLNLLYAGGDRLYVPVDQIDRVSRYIGAGDAAPSLTRLGTQEWERAKRKARAAVQDLADDLLRLYAQRQLSRGHAFSPDGDWQRELEDAFPYVETPDQLKALIDVKHDMELIQPMDRLICGDVGFGKTEVALRAAFKAIQDGKQVAVLVPTTVLAQQHFDTFARRIAAFPVKIDMISRFRSAKEQEAIIQKLAIGEIDVIIGTHRLLSKDIHFKDLGLLVVDEEQRFGVRHKERIKQMRANVDVLTLTATPIPRTLHMALAGIRDLSVIDTPPEDRVPIKTYVLPYEDQLVRESILREMDRGGQVYFVHNRVQSIYHVADKLRQLVPEAEIGVGHGQLAEHQLERVMLNFFSGKNDVLVCTTIIESGLDVPNANTIIIDDATNYGLAQLYQLRGRVGRSAQRAYAYLFYKGDHRMTAEAQERLQAIQEATELGAGFRIAMRDLEIRGAGNLLGAEQSGHIAAVGFDLYSRLLEQAVKTMKAQLVATNYRGTTEDGRRTTNDESPQTVDGTISQASEVAEAGSASPSSSVIRHSSKRQPSVKVDEKVLISPLVTLDLPMDAYLPPEYIPDDRVRLAVYQHMAEAQTPPAVRELRQELRDRFGEPPAPALNLMTWLQIKSQALAAGVNSIVTTPEEFIVRLPEGSPMDREKLRRRFGRDPSVRVGPQFVRLDRRSLGDSTWLDALTGVLETLAK